MAFPGIISRLHHVPNVSQLLQQLNQGEQYRAEAFWLPAGLLAHAREVRDHLSDKCSLYLEQGEPTITLRSHDGNLDPHGRLITQNGQTISLSTTLGDGGLVPVSGLQVMTDWLEAGHLHFICPAAVQPVARAILNIWPLDPYLARHFLTSFIPLLQNVTDDDYLSVFTAREKPETPHSDWVRAYMKLEKKLHRAYLDH